MSLTAEHIGVLQRVTTASITSVLSKLGVCNVWLRGPRALRQGQPRVVGLAFTMRFVPMREDLAMPGRGPALKTTRQAIEEVPAGAVIVVDALGCQDAGAFGDVLAGRMHQRGAAGLVVDGAVRDFSGVLRSGLPVWAGGVAAPLPTQALAFLDWQQPIGCGGVTVFPGDTVVADDDGAVVIPAGFLPEVLAQGPEVEALDAWVVGEVERGQALPGLYPPSEATLARYAAARAGMHTA